MWSYWGSIRVRYAADHIDSYYITIAYYNIIIYTYISQLLYY